MERVPAEVIAETLSFLDLTLEIYPLITSRCLNHAILSFLKPRVLSLHNYNQQQQPSSSKSRRRQYSKLMRKIHFLESLGCLTSIVLLDLSYVHQFWLFDTDQQQQQQEVNMVTICKKLPNLQVINLSQCILTLDDNSSANTQHNREFLCQVLEDIAKKICPKLKLLDVSFVHSSLRERLENNNRSSHELKILDFIHFPLSETQRYNELLDIFNIDPNYPIPISLIQNAMNHYQISIMDLFTFNDYMRCHLFDRVEAVDYLIEQYGVYKFHHTSGTYFIHWLAQKSSCFNTVFHNLMKSTTNSPSSFHDLTDDHERGILHHYCRNRHISLTTLLYLIQCCGDTISVEPDLDNNTPLDYVLKSYHSFAVQTVIGITDIMKELIKNGNRVSLNTLKYSLVTSELLIRLTMETMKEQGTLNHDCLPLLNTAKSVEMLLTIQPDLLLFIDEQQGRTILHNIVSVFGADTREVAKMMQIQEMSQLLLHVRDNRGKTPLQCAFEVNKLPMYECLLESSTSPATLVNVPFAVYDWSNHEIVYVSQLEYFLLVKPNVPMARYVLRKGHDLMELNGKGEKLSTLIHKMRTSSVKRRIPRQKSSRSRRKCRSKTQGDPIEALKSTCIHLQNYVRNLKRFH